MAEPSPQQRTVNASILALQDNEDKGKQLDSRSLLETSIKGRAATTVNRKVTEHKGGSGSAYGKIIKMVEHKGATV